MDKQVKYFKWNPDRIELKIHLGQEIKPLIEAGKLIPAHSEYKSNYLLSADKDVSIDVEEGRITQISFSNHKKMKFFETLK